MLGGNNPPVILPDPPPSKFSFNPDFVLESATTVFLVYSTLIVAFWLHSGPAQMISPNLEVAAALISLLPSPSPLILLCLNFLFFWASDTNLIRFNWKKRRTKICWKLEWKELIDHSLTSFLPSYGYSSTFVYSLALTNSPNKFPLLTDFSFLSCQLAVHPSLVF